MLMIDEDSDVWLKKLRRVFYLVIKMFCNLNVLGIYADDEELFFIFLY